VCCVCGALLWLCLGLVLGVFLVSFWVRVLIVSGDVLYGSGCGLGGRSWGGSGDECAQRNRNTDFLLYYNIGGWGGRAAGSRQQAGSRAAGSRQQAAGRQVPTT